MGGLSAKKKGMHGEYEVRDILQEELNRLYATWNDQVVPGIEEMEKKPCILSVPQLRRNTAQGQQRGQFGVGEAIGYDLAGLDWLAIEVKRQENDSMMSQWWEQCKQSAVNKDGVYVKEPVLIWRRNYMPWKVRMFGYLISEDVPGGSRTRGPVDISLAMFLAYFRERVLVEMKKQSQFVVAQ